MNINLTPYLVLKSLLSIVAFLLIANLVGIICRFYLDSGYIYGLVPLFNFDTELNIPTFYSSITLIICAILLLIISVRQKQHGLPFIGWLFLGLIFVFLALDEIAVLHETLIEPMRERFEATGLLFYAWVIPYGIALILLLILYRNFLTRLPKPYLKQFLISGFIYVLGAIGFEMIGGLHAESNGVDNITYAMITTFEELLEMLGIALFIYALMKYIADNFDYLNINISADKAPQRTPAQRTPDRVDNEQSVNSDSVTT